MLQEVGVAYTHDAEEAQGDVALKPFTVTWYHFPTNTKGEKIIYCYTKLEILTLVNHWNQVGMAANRNKLHWLYILK